MALGEKRNGSVFATAAQRRDAAEYQVTLEPEVVPVVVDDTPQRTLSTDIGTLRQAHNLFFTPSAEGRDFNSVLQEVQEYISGAYAALITGGGEDSKEQLMRYITKYLQDRRIAVAGMTQTELVDAIYSEMGGVRLPDPLYLRRRHLRRSTSTRGGISRCSIRTVEAKSSRNTSIRRNTRLPSSGECSTPPAWCWTTPALWSRGT